MNLLHGFAVFPRNALLAIAVTAMAFIYRGASFSFQVGRRHAMWFGFFMAALVFANLSTIGEPLACDELYHAGMSALGIHAVEMISTHGMFGQWLANRPMPEAAGLVSFVFCVLAGLVSLLVMAVQRHATHLRSFAIWGAGFLLTLAIAQLFRNFPLRQEMHPPLRLLPIFVSQTVFGLDDLSFRLAGVVLAAVAGTCVASFVLDFRKRKKNGVSPGGLWDADYLLATVCGLLAIFVPPVLHASVIVQPSIFCFVVWIFVFVLTDRYLRLGEHEDVIAAGLCVGLGSLMRQNALVLWPVVGLALLLRRPPFLVWMRALLPGIWLLPFLGVLARSNHPAASNASFMNVWDAIASGKLFQILVNGTSLPWLALTVIVTAWLLTTRAWRNVPGLLVLVALVPAILLYFMIWPYLSWVGRYQAEYVGAAIAIVCATAGSIWPRRRAILFCLSAFYLFAYSLHMNTTLNQDIYYAEWPQKRVTTESVYPYRGAMGFLHRQPASEKFAWIGGVPVYGPWFLYLRGYSAAQVATWKSLQGRFESLGEKAQTAPELIKVLKDAGVSYVAIQYGDKRESQHRAGWQNNAENWIRDAARKPDSGISLEHRFYSSFEGAIDLFTVR
jgi:hypothetical protein